MEIIRKLNSELLRQRFSNEQKDTALLEKYLEAAQAYSVVENALAVLSDMRSNVSYIYYGRFALTLGIKLQSGTDKCPSIWEEQILKLIHPDDLHDKLLMELRFFHFMKRLPKSKRDTYCFVGKLRMKDVFGIYHSVQHRIFYASAPSGNTLWLALCLYTPLYFDVPSSGMIVNSETGDVMKMDVHTETKILSEREKQVLRLIGRGMTSKQISDLLSISIHTVSRHRQEILKKLRVKSSIEAYRVASELGI